MRAVLEEEYGSRLRDDLAGVEVGIDSVEVLTTWTPGAKAHRRGLDVCRTVASYVHERAPQGQFSRETQVSVSARGDGLAGVVAYFDVLERECRTAGMLVPEET